jgi:hypothetical protein
MTGGLTERLAAGRTLLAGATALPLLGDGALGDGDGALTTPALLLLALDLLALTAPALLLLALDLLALSVPALLLLATGLGLPWVAGTALALPALLLEPGRAPGRFLSLVTGFPWSRGDSSRMPGAPQEEKGPEATLDSAPGPS